MSTIGSAFFRLDFLIPMWYNDTNYTSIKIFIRFINLRAFMQLILLRPIMTKKFISAFSKILWDSDLIASRFMLAFAEFLWGILLLWPGDTFNRQYYHNMAYLMSENVWGILFLITSIFQFSIVIRNILHSRLARIFAIWNTFIWITAVTSLVLIYPPSAAMGGEISLMLVAIWIWVRPYILAEGYKRAI